MKESKRDEKEMGKDRIQWAQKMPKQNDLKQINTQLTFVKSREMDTWVSEISLFWMFKIFSNSDTEEYVLADHQKPRLVSGSH